jgi:DNA-binding response OmpR family regulator
LNVFPRVVVLSRDAVLPDLIAQLLHQEHFVPVVAGDLPSLDVACRASPTSVVLIDAIESDELAWDLLSDPWGCLGDAQPALIVLASGMTSREVLDHAYIDRVLAMPLSLVELVDTVRYHTRCRPRRAMSSGVQLRVAGELVADADLDRAASGTDD